MPVDLTDLEVSYFQGAFIFSHSLFCIRSISSFILTLNSLSAIVASLTIPDFIHWLTLQTCWPEGCLLEHSGTVPGDMKRNLQIEQSLCSWYLGGLFSEIPSSLGAHENKAACRIGICAWIFSVYLESIAVTFPLFNAHFSFQLSILAPERTSDFMGTKKGGDESPVKPKSTVMAVLLEATQWLWSLRVHSCKVPITLDFC